MSAEARVRLASFAIVAALLAATACAPTEQISDALVLERTIALPDVVGRVDHLSIDPARQHLIVAELGNNAVDVVDVARGAVLHRIVGLHEPQGLAFDTSGRIIVVAERGDGAVRLFDALSFAPLAVIPLGADADNVRTDPRNGHIVVGYGDGGLAILDAPRRAVLSRISLSAHPEGFQIDPRTGRAVVNVPDSHAIDVVDLDSGEVTVWRLPGLLYNFPLALDSRGTRVASVFRLPARVVLFDGDTGGVIASQPTCGDSDDLFFDARRHRLYVACGAGAVEVFDVADAALRRIARIPTGNGARTALFVPELDRLFVAERAQGAVHDGAILVFRPED